MSRSHRNRIWSCYTTSPDPLSGMDSLCQTCSRLTSHVLKPAHVVPVGDGFILHPDLAEPLAEAVPAIDSLLRVAAYHSPRNAQYIGDKEFQVLTMTAGRHSYATQRQIVTDWFTLMEHLTAAMRELRALCIGDTSNPSRGVRSSRAPSINPELPLALRGELPRTSRDSYGTRIAPEVSSRSHSRFRAIDTEPQELKSVIGVSTKKEKQSRTSTMLRGASANHSGYTPLKRDSMSSCRRYLAPAMVERGGLQVEMAEPRAAVSLPKDEGCTPAVPILEALPSRAAPPHYAALSPDTIRGGRARAAPPGPCSKPRLQEEAAKPAALTPLQRSPASARVEDEAAIDLRGLQDVKDPFPHPRIEALDVARVTPPPKSPAPVPAIADTVELGGLRDEVTLPRMAASARVPMEGAVAERDARQGLDRLARSHLAAESSAQWLSETESSAWQRSGIPQERILHDVDTVPNQQDAASRGKELRTVDRHSSVLVRGVATSSAPRPLASPLPRSIDTDGKAFALVNAIVRTIPSSHLVFDAHGDLVPEIAWEREGIGTRPWP
ncbi:hypothetical protein B0H15DRAFT_796953 [Mycena belliarum]|uniref:Uncharacterized protein n=1 Tax=Mycena belliarum TaxID=1033014 RepID=A0AAD6XZF7_9AGAR|nr:hypothetical protein B0H15DRAFT_796953 [Mycena belliae]